MDHVVNRVSVWWFAIHHRCVRCFVRYHAVYRTPFHSRVINLPVRAACTRVTLDTWPNMSGVILTPVRHAFIFSIHGWKVNCSMHSVAPTWPVRLKICSVPFGSIFVMDLPSRVWCFTFVTGMGVWSVMVWRPITSLIRIPNLFNQPGVLILTVTMMKVKRSSLPMSRYHDNGRRRVKKFVYLTQRYCRYYDIIVGLMSMILRQMIVKAKRRITIIITIIIIMSRVHIRITQIKCVTAAVIIKVAR